MNAENHADENFKAFLTKTLQNPTKPLESIGKTTKTFFHFPSTSLIFNLAVGLTGAKQSLVYFASFKIFHNSNILQVK